MQHDVLIFDLDGTISDPAVGFVNSINYALEANGLERKGASEITRHIGPPLDVTLPILLGSDDKTLMHSMVDKYRERYLDTGFTENVLYDGVRENLLSLANNDAVRIGVCTSKPVKSAKRILDMFGLLDLFEFVSGGDIGIGKWQQLEALRDSGTITENSLMIGDRSVDLTAAHKNDVLSAGVLWGYGSQSELEAENPKYILKHPNDLLEL